MGETSSAGALHGLRLLAAAEQDQMRALGRRQPQRARERLEHVERGADVASLLEPRVPGGPDSGQQRDLFAAQARRAPAAAVGEPDVLGLEARALGAQEVGQLLPTALAVAGLPAIARLLAISRLFLTAAAPCRSAIAWVSPLLPG